MSNSFNHQGGHGKTTGYVSEFAQFMHAFMESHPEVVVNQRKGWNIFWDKNVNFEELKDATADSVPVKSYYYF